MILKGKKVILRYPKLSDAKWLFENIKKPEISKNLASFVDDMKSIGDEIKWIKKQPARRKNKTHFNFVITDKKNHLIGGCGLHTLDTHIAGAGWWITKEYWGKDYATDAIRQLVNFGFRKLKLNRIEADVFKFNPRSLNFAKKLGFKLEGIKRQRWFKRSKFLDAYAISLLRQEWKG
ncbi:MAG: GNAT family N-acetyltransferase [DPANN group archaeon]|nr:GNAT family N-acetyltransferase [DPANN group archaeon]